jgi:hypothetical protein
MSLSLSARASSGRCVACNNRVAFGWMCESCGICSTTVGARLRDDVFPVQASTIAKRAQFRLGQGWAYEEPAGEARSVRVRSNVDPLEQLRIWCDECTAARFHRPGCSIADLEGRQIGGRSEIRVFGDLREPQEYWTKHHWKRHKAALRRRWDAFLLSWTRIGLEFAAAQWSRAA